MFCKHSGVCGGCSFQEVPYHEQLKGKQKKIEELFPSCIVESIVSDEPWHYRNKMEFTFSQDKAGNPYLGLMKARGRVEDLEECLISKLGAGEILARTRKWWKESGLSAYYPRKDEGSLLNLTLRSGKNESQMIILTVSGNPVYALNQRHLNSFVKEVSREGDSVFLLIRRIAKGEPTEFYEMHLAGPKHVTQSLCGMEFTLSPQAFFQPNVQVAEKMFQRAIALLELRGEEKVLDLFCGIGTIGMLLSKHVRQVVGIELSKNAICDAKENLKRLGIENMHVYQGDAGKTLKEIMQFFSPDIVVVDPPRCGLDTTSRQLIQEIRPKYLLYISCNPETQAKDIEVLKGFAIERVAPFDQFPHTPHVENIALLSRM